VWFDYELGEKEFSKGFVCDELLYRTKKLFENA
jgi:hypothetical protein